MPSSSADKPDDLPPDIRQRAIADFGVAEGEKVYQDLLRQIPDGLPNGTRPRHLRCILYLAQGELTRLKTYIQMCLEDTRDVMLNAEYDRADTARPIRKRDFAQPFDKGELTKRATNEK